jgi:hypothetical protein
MDTLPPPAIVAPHDARDAVNLDARAAVVQARLRATLPGTRVERVHASALPGFFAVRLANGRLAYTDAEARYLVLGVAFDLHSGQALDGALDAQDRQP